MVLLGKGCMRWNPEPLVLMVKDLLLMEMQQKRVQVLWPPQHLHAKSQVVTCREMFKPFGGSSIFCEVVSISFVLKLKLLSKLYHHAGGTRLLVGRVLGKCASRTEKQQIKGPPDWKLSNPKDKRLENAELHEFKWTAGIFQLCVCADNMILFT
jgi:hypothetical protein